MICVVCYDVFVADLLVGYEYIPHSEHIHLIPHYQHMHCKKRFGYFNQSVGYLNCMPI